MPKTLAHYCFFRATARVVPRRALSVRDEKRAKETVRVFALDCPGLRSMRKGYLDCVLHAFEQACSAGFSDEELRDQLRAIAADYESYPFSSAVLDLLGL
jgi:hypothetical protein